LGWVVSLLGAPTTWPVSCRSDPCVASGEAATATVGVTVGLRDAVGVTVGPGVAMGADEHALVSMTITTETAARFIGLSLLAEHQSAFGPKRDAGTVKSSLIG